MNNPKFEIFQSEKNEEFYFRLKAKNGEIILQSEGYKTKAGCRNGVESVKTNAPNDDLYERKESTNEKFFFVLKAKNHEVIGKSQMYKTKESRDNGINSVKENAPNALIIELEKMESN